MRIIFIPGFGEDEFIFDRIKDGLPGEQLVLSLWNELPQEHHPGLQVREIAEKVAQRYSITAADLVIGHSAGGWLGLHLKQLVGCPLIQVASWSDPDKIMVPVRSRRLIYFAARTGLYLNRFILRRALNRYYKATPSRPVFERVFLRLITGNRANVVNQLRIIFNPVQQPLTAIPDLRIHAREDRVIRYPDGAVQEVPGDHFCVYTYPEQVSAPIRNFIHHQSIAADAQSQALR